MANYVENRRRARALALRRVRTDRASVMPAFARSWVSLRPTHGEAVYRLVEFHADVGRWEEEAFLAPDDETAWRRVREATTGEVVVLWRGGRLVGIHRATPARPR